MTNPDLPNGVQDQLDAANAETWRNAMELLAEEQAKVVDDDELGLALDNEYRKACQNIGNGEWTICTHLTGGPRPMHWVPNAPNRLLCDDCWRDIDTGQCMMCRRREPWLIHADVFYKRHRVMLHGTVCRDCYDAATGNTEIERD
jgi:hypothetical protein